MKKILGIVVLGLIFCNTSFADLNLYCKQEVRIIQEKNSEKTIPMEQMWELLITDDEIFVHRWSSMYKNLLRSDKGDSKFYASDEPARSSDGDIYYWTVVQIDRTTGKGSMWQTIAGTTTISPFKCSTEKPKLLF